MAFHIVTRQDGSKVGFDNPDDAANYRNDVNPGSDVEVVETAAEEFVNPPAPAPAPAPVWVDPNNPPVNPV